MDSPAGRTPGILMKTFYFLPSRYPQQEISTSSPATQVTAVVPRGTGLAGWPGLPQPGLLPGRAGSLCRLPCTRPGPALWPRHAAPDTTSPTQGCQPAGLQPRSAGRSRRSLWDVGQMCGCLCHSHGSHPGTVLLQLPSWTRKEEGHCPVLLRTGVRGPPVLCLRELSEPVRW
jgi:hypothetical protein